MTDVDVIVLDLDGGAMLEECLLSIREQTAPAAAIVLFDNGSRVPAEERIEADGIRIVRSPRNLGFAGGANAALAHCSAPYVALVNNDVVLRPEWLRSVRDALDRDERLGAVQTIIERPDGAIDGAGIDISDGTYRQVGHGLPLGAALAVAWGVSATATLYRRAAIGSRFFDEGFFAYYEDVELSARLREEGWRLSVLPLVLATHRGSQTGHILGRDALRLRTRNRYRVARMHKGVGRRRSLLWEDVKLMLRGRASIRGLFDGLFGRLK